MNQPDEHRAAMTHTLKTDHAVFQQVANGTKTFEIRKADRDYRVGDYLDLLETVNTGSEMAAGAPLEYTGGAVGKRIVGILHGPIYGLAAGWCVMSLEDIPYDFNPEPRLSALPAGGGWIPVSQRPEKGALIVKRWKSGSVWAGVYSGTEKDSAFDEWFALPAALQPQENPK